jgi:hypothetical protein
LSLPTVRSGSPIPVYGIGGYYEGIKAEPEQEKHNVYRVDPKSGDIKVVIDDFVEPNGIAPLSQMAAANVTLPHIVGATTRISGIQDYIFGPLHSTTHMIYRKLHGFSRSQT